MVKIGGERREEGDRDRTRWHARKIFLEKISEIEPAVLDALREDVLPLFATAFAVTGSIDPPKPPEWIDWRWQNGDWEETEQHRPGELSNLREGLISWAGDWNIDEDWVLDVAQRTLHLWLFRTVHRGREIERPLEFRTPRFVDAGQGPTFYFEFRPWFPRWRRWNEYSDSIREAFETQLSEYRERRDEQMEELGLPLSPEKRGQVGRDPLQHFEWLVRHQVSEEKQKYIAQNPGAGREQSVSVKTVQIACRNISQIIDLTRRSKL